ncbi:regulatory protein, luxR family [Gracilibacillus ureilyticus]|uniref:Regulatory protein, luxR family n=1 Tax=Gracilibacillus ureilyticus TaxID=531814 RepID=A0A1H9UM76_9BACI|nr:LuxR C-terminal-related transcriptional regulator [Gracilibacillus ureilyticus]SES10237.1 regulatory protein, luxR family [Gracilibacillus ureilyticus]
MAEGQKHYIPERLSTTFHRILKKKITFINAPGGYGKSTLTNHWSMVSDFPFRSMEITDSCNNPQTLHLHLTRILNETKDTRSIIVIDHVHRVKNKEAISSLQECLLKASPNIHFILLSRESITPLAHISDIQYQTLQLNANDLKLTQEETIGWISNHTSYSIEISEKQLEEIFTVTDGCPALLQLAYQHYSQGQLPLIDEQGRVAPLLEKFIVNEWMSQLPGKAVNQMRPLTIPPYLSLDFARELLQTDVHSLFNTLEHHLLLNKVLVESRWMYCFHPLVRVIIKEILPDKKFKRPVYEKTALFLEKEGFIKEAFDMAILADKPALALQYLKKFAPQALELEEYDTLQGWFHRLDPLYTSADKEAASLQHWTLIMLNRAEENDNSGQKANLLLQTEKDTWTPYLALNQGSIPFNRNSFGFNGNIHETVKELQFPHKTSAFTPYRKLAIAEALYEQNDKIAAREYLETVWQSAIADKHPGISIPALWLELLCHQSEGRIKKVHYLTEEIFFRSLQTNNPVWRRTGKAIKTYTLLNEGFLEDAEDWLAEQKEFLHILWNQMTSFEYFTLTRSLLAFQEVEEADNLLRRMITSTSADKNIGNHLERRLLQTICAIKLEQTTEAELLLKDALEVGHKYGYIRSFLDQDPTLFLIFPNVKNDLPSHLSEYCTNLLQLANKEESKILNDNPEMKNALTLHEIEIIKYIQQGFSNRKIGDQLNITEGTVKGHLHRIYKKLNVSNRVQAVKAAENQLLL